MLSLTTSGGKAKHEQFPSLSQATFLRVPFQILLFYIADLIFPQPLPSHRKNMYGSWK